ncbi:ParA family protein [Acinetobacter baumannii]|uniref:ParA family protein n=1 Tax=Acinetobacter baumannii TaxID=470 RepID=UPI0020912E9E|nr:ParA family protein [Acinetobacter baumannii]
MAEIITIASRKGGVGKTTIAINMVVALSNKGKTLLVDADEQQSAMKWNKHRKEKIDAISIHKDLIAELEKLDGEYQYILIDVAGRDSEIFREALLISDKLIVPTQASLLDLDVIPYLNEKVKTAKKNQSKLGFNGCD